MRLLTRLGLPQSTLDRIAAISPQITVINRASGEQYAAELPQADAVFGSVSGEDLSLAKKLRWIQYNAAGVEHVLSSQLVASDVQLTNARGCHSSQIAEHAFGPCPCVEMLLGSVDGRAVSYAIFFPHFGSFRGRPWLYLEDLYVQPAARGTGVGRAMMSALARIVVERSWAGMTWGVLEWNEPAFRFYEGLGAVRANGHVYMELSGEALERVANA